MKKQKTQNSNKLEITSIFLTIIGLIISMISLYIAFLVRSDTAELSKFSDKPLYYNIKLYPLEDMSESQVGEKYANLNLNLKLIVDDFEIKKKNFLDVNYNAVFTKIKYYMVYDYDLKIKNYKYMVNSLDDRLEAKFHFDDEFYIAPVQINYSLTPNNNFFYLLIYTETTTIKNLDLIFFNYHDNGKTFSLDTVLDNENKEMIDIKKVNDDTIICNDYYLEQWSENDESKKKDLSFMFDVYKDLKEKIFKN